MEQRGLFREVLDILYNNEGIIEPDEESLRRMCQCERIEWKRSWPAVYKLFDDVEGKMSHPKVRDTITKLEKYHSKRKAAGRSGASKRWAQTKKTEDLIIAEPKVEHSSPIDLPLAERWQNDSPEAWQNDSLPLPQHQHQHQHLPLPQARALLPPVEFDVQWTAFREACKQSGAFAGATDDDWLEARHPWNLLDFNQKLTAISDIRVRDPGAVEVRSPALPRNYISKGRWNRGHVSPQGSRVKLEEKRELTNDEQDEFMRDYEEKKRLRAEGAH